MTALISRSVIKGSKASQLDSPELKSSALRFVCSAVSLRVSAGREGRGSGPVSLSLSVTTAITAHDKPSIGIDFDVERTSYLSVQLGEGEHHMAIECRA